MKTYTMNRHDNALVICHASDLCSHLKVYAWRGKNFPLAFNARYFTAHKVRMLRGLISLN